MSNSKFRSGLWSLSRNKVTPPLPAVQLAVEALEAGRLEEAESRASVVLATRAQEPIALNVLGCVALARNHLDEATKIFEGLRAIRSKDPIIHFYLGEAYRLKDDAASALRCFRKAVKLHPKFAEAHGQIGDILRAIGHLKEAEVSYKIALSLKPDLAHCLTGFGLLMVQQGELGQAAGLFEAALRVTPSDMSDARAILWANLGQAHIDAGSVPEGLRGLAEAVNCAPNDPTYWRALALNLNNVKVVPPGVSFRKKLIALLQRQDIDPRLLATAAIASLKQQSEIDALLDRLAQGALVSDPIGKDDRTARMLLDDELFRVLLSTTPIRDVGIEVLLTSIRGALLRDIVKGAAAAQWDFDFVCALARQCDLNEYIFWSSVDEESIIASFVDELSEASGFQGSAADWCRLAIVACYGRLPPSLVPNLTHCPEPLRGFLRKQLSEEAKERDISRSIAVLAPLRNDFSRNVQKQYEENPYPRWTRCQISTPRLLRDVILSVLPHLAADELPAAENPRILIAGCGTGIQTMNVVQTYANATVLAIDLSLNSLAYGIRKLAEYGVDSVRHAQADILDLADLKDRFDLIESFGVLHHMREPIEGLKILANLLAPGGVLFLGIYSRLARSSVIAARNLIAELRLKPTQAGIREGRRAIMFTSERVELRPLLSPASDFWTMSECRDLIFHVAEHQFTLLEIGSMLEIAGLEFLGLEINHAFDKALFAAECPATGAARSLSTLHAFEVRHPETFGDTYRIWAKRVVRTNTILQ